MGSNLTDLQFRDETVRIEGLYVECSFDRCVLAGPATAVAFDRCYFEDCEIPEDVRAVIAADRKNIIYSRGVRNA